MQSIGTRRWMLPLVVLGLVAIALIVVYAVVLAAGQRAVTGQITLTGLPNGVGCGVDGQIIALEGTGELTQLGATTVTATNCSRGNLETGPGVLFDGQATFTAADGSSVSVVYDGSQLQTSPPGMTTFRVLQTITGGTGRFAGATGEWTISGTVFIYSGELHGEVDGWITY